MTSRKGAVLGHTTLPPAGSPPWQCLDHSDSVPGAVVPTVSIPTELPEELVANAIPAAAYSYWSYGPDGPLKLGLQHFSTSLGAA
ncbi:MAG: hypothetical protein ACYC1D_08285 [Acidimicrobiales bacterium]